ncbi:MAG: M3 family metallopeptidase [Burkholderiaceae bacterium]
MAVNPLLDFSGLPRFDAFDPAQIGPAMDVLLQQAQQGLKQATDDTTPADWEHVVLPLEQATERLSRAWGIVGHLSGVSDTKALRAAHNEYLPRITRFWTELGQSQALFARYKALLATHGDTLSPVRRRIVENALRDFRLGGAELVPPASERYAQLQERQAVLSQKFSENVLDATNAFELLITERQQLEGLPADAIDAAQQDAARAGKTGFRFTLQFPSYFPVMQYANDRQLRERLYRASVTRASANAVAPSDEETRSKLDNTQVIDELLALRSEEAALLGYGSFAELSLEAKMAETPEQVITFLRDLAERARASAQNDLQEMRDFAAQSLGLPTLEPWDMAYAAERLRQKRYAFSDQLVKQYFQLPRVLQGLFTQIERLFDVTIRQDEAPTWHDSVAFYRIERDGRLLGQFYTDLFARESKRPGAWMDGARSRAVRTGDVQTPLAYLVCNFQPPVGERPALLNHDDVITLFHEFGHGLHHMLTEVDEISVSGISGVEWDAVELPSQFMENFCWEWPIVESMSAHVDTGQALPRDLFDKMLAAKNFQAGMQTLRQIEFSLFDMLLHARDRRIEGIESVQSVLDAVRQEVAVVQAPEFNRFQNAFSHIFSGGYSAGYYSYKWAEVLSADAYAAFEEAAKSPEPVKALRETGARFLAEVLAVGGSRPAIDSFRAFRGRDPDIQALLRHNGMEQNA